MPDGDETRKALDKLVHDLRTPLGAALGYVRLVRDRRLVDEQEQQRALTQTIEALGAMSQLCRDAASFAASADVREVDFVIIPAADLTAEVGGHLAPPLAFTDLDHNLSGHVRVQQGGATARAVAVLLSRVGLSGGATPSTDIIVRVADQHLSFETGTPAQRQALHLGERRVFNPWRSGPGLAVPLACLEVARVSGRVWTEADSSTAIAVMLPLETSTS